MAVSRFAWGLVGVAAGVCACARLDDLTSGNPDAGDAGAEDAASPSDAGAPPTDGATPPPTNSGQPPCNTASDPHNCGACGHDCRGGLCVAGACQPLSLAKPGSVDNLAVDGNYVYWAGSAVYACAVGGCQGNPSVVAASGGEVAADGANVYFVDFGSNATTVYRCPPGPSCPNPTLLATVNQPDTVEALAAAGGTAYFIQTRQVSRCPATGCGGTGAEVVAIPSGTSGGTMLNVSGSTLVWASTNGALSTNEIFTCPVAGCSAPATTFTANRYFDALATDAEFTYWAADQGSFDFCPTSGCNGAPASYALENPAYVASDGTDVYWARPNGGGIARCAAGTFCANPDTFVAGVSAANLAVDATSLYWVGSDGTIEKLAK